MGTARASASIRVLVVSLGLAALATGAVAQVPVASSDLRLPTDGAGTGTIAVRLTYPADPAAYRYPDGAPVAIYLPGGFSVGGLGAGQRIAEQGFVVVSFVYPGGVTPLGSSDGTYDWRGDDCQRALRDVILFAEGAATDALGRTIDDVVPGPVHPGIVGFAPYSNGLIGLITLGRYGAAIPFAPYQSGWENPTSGQIVTGDLGTIGEDCEPTVDADGNGIGGDDSKNPWYDLSGYGPTGFDVDYVVLRWDSGFPQTYTDPTGRCAPVARSGALFLDGTGNGRVDARPGAPNCPDYDGDGVLETSEDFRFRPVTTFDALCRPKVYFSNEVTVEAAERGLFSTGWPPWIATPAEAAAFWPLRDATAHWDAISLRFPEFRAMTVFTAQDHVQAQDDHPHVRQVLDGLRARGHWHRLNTDAAYYEASNGVLPAGYVETPAGATVPRGAMKAHAEPQGLLADAMQAAGHAEMADRLHAGCWWPDLDSVMRPSVPSETETRALEIAPDRATITWSTTAGAYCYDVLRGYVHDLALDATRVILDGAACVDDDSTDTLASDGDAPPPGTGYYYVVKPNGIHGSWGSASQGLPREDASRGCD